MIVPEYWAEARLQTREEGRQITIRRFGWSDDSQEAAEGMAQERATEAMRRARAGEKLDRREFKIPYNGADGVPIREEILARHGDVVITRNSYGAPCLNTPDVMFLDVDFDEKAGCGLMVRIWQLLALIVVSYAIVERSWRYAAIGLAISAALAPMVASFLKKTWIRWSGGVEKVARKRIDHFLKAHPDWNLRVYRTPAGFRLLALHRTFQSDDPEVESAFKSLDVDEMYARMCRNQRCFRARVGPKPWRIGIGDHLRPRPGVWPVHPDRLPLRQEWLDRYNAKAPGFASCQYVEDLGSGVMDAKVASVAKVHDELSRAHSGLTPA